MIDVLSPNGDRYLISNAGGLALKIKAPTEVSKAAGGTAYPQKEYVALKKMPSPLTSYGRDGRPQYIIRDDGNVLVFGHIKGNGQKTINFMG
jgi:hypothetical protein